MSPGASVSNASPPGAASPGASGAVSPGASGAAPSGASGAAPSGASGGGAIGSEQSFSDGQQIFAEGQLSDFAYQVVAGEVELSKSYPEGAMRLAVLGAGELFGEMGLLDGTVRSAAAYARGPVVLRVLDKEQLLSLVQQRPDFALNLVKTISKRLRHTNALIKAPDATATQHGWGHFRAYLRRLIRPGELDIDRVRLEFQPDAIEIEERPVPWGAKAILYTILALIICAVVWASVARMDRIVIATGTIVTADAKIVVQPMETATVRAVNVHPGQVVEKGEVLISLDSTFTTADERSVRAQMRSAGAEMRRLEAELALSSGDARPPGPFSEDAAEQAAQAEVFERFVAARDTTIKASAAEIKELETHAASLSADRANVANQLAVAQRLESIRRKVYGQASGTLINVLDAQHQVAVDRRELDRIVNEIGEAAQKIKTVEAKREAALGEMNAKAAQELQSARRDYSKAFEQIKKQERLSALIDLRSPAKAMVLELGARSVGSVVKEGEPLVTLVALDVPVVIEAIVEPKDISHLRAGDSVRIKLESFPYQKYGTLDGVIQAINGDVLEQEVGGRKISVYKIRVAITRENLRDVPKDFALLPGMAASCEIKVGTRRLISYFLYPIIRTLDSGLREP